jgi:ankyrin repeat protein
VVKAAAKNWSNGKAAIALLLDPWSRIGGDKESWLRISRLYNAAKHGDAAAVCGFIDNGTPPDKQNIRGVTPLWTASLGGHKAVVQVLLGTGVVGVNIRNMAGRTPLFPAAANGHSEVVPLSVAQHYRQVDVIDILTNHGIK